MKTPLDEVLGPALWLQYNPLLSYRLEEECLESCPMGKDLRGTGHQLAEDEPAVPRRISGILT